MANSTTLIYLTTVAVFLHLAAGNPIGIRSTKSNIKTELHSIRPELPKATKTISPFLQYSTSDGTSATQSRPSKLWLTPFLQVNPTADDGDGLSLVGIICIAVAIPLVCFIVFLVIGCLMCPRATAMCLMCKCLCTLCDAATCCC